MQCVTQRGSSQTCCSVRVVANIIMQPVLRLVPRPSKGQAGSAQSVKCVRLAGKSNCRESFTIIIIIMKCTIIVNQMWSLNILHYIYIILIFLRHLFYFT